MIEIRGVFFAWYDMACLYFKCSRPKEVEGGERERCGRYWRRKVEQRHGGDYV